jgi:hypothetical protein
MTTNDSMTKLKAAVSVLILTVLVATKLSSRNEVSWVENRQADTAASETSRRHVVHICRGVFLILFVATSVAACSYLLFVASLTTTFSHTILSLAVIQNTLPTIRYLMEASYAEPTRQCGDCRGVTIPFLTEMKLLQETMHFPLELKKSVVVTILLERISFGFPVSFLRYFQVSPAPLSICPCLFLVAVAMGAHSAHSVQSI